MSEIDFDDKDDDNEEPLMEKIHRELKNIILYNSENIPEAFKYVCKILYDYFGDRTKDESLIIDDIRKVILNTYDYNGEGKLHYKYRGINDELYS